MAQTVTQCLTSAMDSVNLIDGVKAGSWDVVGMTQAEINEMVQRNVDHLELILAYDDKEVKVSELTNEQQYFHSQILDLTNKQKRIQFELDQINASLSVFQNAFIESAKQKADEVLNNPEEDKNDDT
jgi:hypothetical protein